MREESSFDDGILEIERKLSLAASSKRPLFSTSVCADKETKELLSTFVGAYQV